MLNEQAVEFPLISDNIMLFGVSFIEGDRHVTTQLDHDTHVIISYFILAYKCHEYDLMKTVGTDRWMEFLNKLFVPEWFVLPWSSGEQTTSLRSMLPICRRIFQHVECKILPCFARPE